MIAYARYLEEFNLRFSGSSDMAISHGLLHY